jgi:hypothetical protein
VIATHTPPLRSFPRAFRPFKRNAIKQKAWKSVLYIRLFLKLNTWDETCWPSWLGYNVFHHIQKKNT